MPSPEVIESVLPCSGQYSCKRDLRLNAWLLVAAVVYLVQWALVQRHPEWQPLIRLLLALSPLVPALLYIRSWVRFIRGLDELQRRVQLSAHLFAAWSTIITGIILTTLHRQGVMDILPHGLGFGGVMMFALFFWSVGVGIANCRYR